MNGFQVGSKLTVLVGREGNEQAIPQRRLHDKRTPPTHDAHGVQSALGHSVGRECSGAIPDTLR